MSMASEKGGTEEMENEIPVIEPGLQEIPLNEPNIEKEKLPPIPPEKIQEIIDMIENEEKVDEDHKKEVEDVIRKRDIKH